MRRQLPLLIVLMVVACTYEPGVSSVSPTTSRLASPTGAASTTEVLVFQVASPPDYHFTLTSANGSVVKVVDTTAGSGSVWQGDSAALLLYGPNNTHAVLTKEGTVTEFQPALNAMFDIGTAGGIGVQAGEPILIDTNTALGLAGYADTKYEEIDLRSGAASALVAAASNEPSGAGGGIRPSTAVATGTSNDRRTARLIVRHCTVNGTAVPGWALLVIDLTHKTVTTFRQLSAPSGLDPFDVSDPAVSPDGRWLAYQESSQVDPNNAAILRTHIVDLVSGKDVALPDTSIQIVGNSRGLRFSPDGSALMEYGLSAGPSFPQHSRLAVFATSDGRELKTLDVGDSAFNMVQPIGWTGGHVLVYTVTTTNVLGNFTHGNQVGHSLDVLIGTDRLVPAGLGQLIAVLT